MISVFKLGAMRPDPSFSLKESEGEFLRAPSEMFLEESRSPALHEEKNSGDPFPDVLLDSWEA